MNATFVCFLCITTSLKVESREKYTVYYTSFSGANIVLELYLFGDIVSPVDETMFAN